MGQNPVDRRPWHTVCSDYVEYEATISNYPGGPLLQDCDPARISPVAEGPCAEWTVVKAMKNKVDDVTTACATFVAAYVAMAIGFVARDDLGLPPDKIRTAAITFAVLIAALLAIDFIKRFGKV